MLVRTLLLLTLLGTQGTSLKWTPKEGDQLKFRTVGQMSVSGIEATITAVNSHKVIRVNPDGSFVVQATPLEGKAVYAGTEMEMKGVTTITTYGPNGEVNEIIGDKTDATAYRMANLTHFHSPTKPVAVGDAWTSEGRADPKTGSLAWKADYKVVAEETVGAFATLKLDVKARETEGSEPGSAAGTMWIGKDGIPVKSELTWTNMTVPGAPGLVSGKLTQTRVE